MKTVALAVIGALGLVGCTPSYLADSDAPVLMIIAAINGGNVLASDLAIETGVCPDVVPVAIAIRAKNQNPAFNPVNILMHVLIQRYEVRYYRSDGRGAEGVDVPYRISGNLAFEIDVATSGATAVNIEVVRRQAKLEPPLVRLKEDFHVLTMFAEITIHGRTIAGQGVSATGAMQIDFADFNTTLTECPVN